MGVGLGDQIGKYLLIVCERCGIVRANDNDQIISAWEIVPEQTDRFSQESFYAISAHGIANSARHAQTPAAMNEIVWFAIESKWTAGLLHRGGVYSGEGDVAAQAVGARKCV
jgi:hypothetical protein